jgi:hypothetical protein
MKQNTDGFVLSITSLFLFFPIIVFIYKDDNNLYETLLALLLFINILLSSLFWSNPIQNSVIHFYDGIFGKISYFLFTIYILFVKQVDYRFKLAFLGILIVSLTLFYQSNEHSKKKWCSKNHLLCHSIFHILIGIGSSIAFV